MTPTFEEFQFTSFKFCRVYYDLCKGLPAEKQDKFLKNILAYVFERKEPHFAKSDSEVETAFLITKPILDKNMQQVYKRSILR